MSRVCCGTVIAAMLTMQLSLLVGCSRGPAAVHQPEFDPAEASQQAMDLYDANHDGELSEQEMASCPGVLANRPVYDTDNNRTVSRQEIEDRLRKLRLSGTGLTSLNIEVRLNGRPLRGAEVQLIPEAYLGTNVKSAWGKSNRRGMAVIDVRDEDLPAAEQGLIGVHYGTYKVKITHPSVQIPAKYNTQTTLGYETQRGNPDFRLDLSSR